MITIEEVIKEIQKNDRVCPQPDRWNQLYQLLPNKQRKRNCWEPPLPLILAAWRDTPAMLKMLRLKEHIEWAAKQECLEEVYAFILSLNENDWHHIDD